MSQTDSADPLPCSGGEVPSSTYRSPQEARRILISMMFPSMLMPMISSMSRVALQHFLDQALPTVEVYQRAFLILAVFRWQGHSSRSGFGIPKKS